MAAELEVGIGVDLKDLNEGLKRATDKFQEFGTKMGSIGSMMSLAITAPLVLVGKQMIKLASDSQEATNKVEVAFGKSSDAVKEFASTSLTQFGIAKGSAMDMASTYGDMSTSMGLTQQQAAQLSISLVGLAADLASFKNIGIDQANTALKGIFTGETESLKTLGIVMTEANLKAYALSKGFKGNTEDLTQGEKVLLRYNYVLENTKNSQGDFARTGGGAANQMRIFGESLKEIGDTFGSTILPYFTKAITYVNNLMKEFAKLDGETKKNILIGAVFVAAIGPTLVAISAIITAVKTIGLAFVGINAPIIAAIALVSAFAYGASENFSTLKTNLNILSREFYNFEVTLVRLLRLINGNEWTNNRLMQLQDELVKRSDKINNIGFGKGIESFVAGIKKANAGLSGLLDFTGKTGGGGNAKGGLTKIKEDVDRLADSLRDLDIQQKTTNIQGYWEDISRISASTFGGNNIGSLMNTMQLDKANAAKVQKDKDLISQLFGGDLAQSTANLQAKLDALKGGIKPLVENFGLKVSKDVKVALSYVDDAVKQSFSFLGDVIANGFASVFNKDIKFDFKKMLGNFLSGLGEMVMSMALQMKAIAALKTKVELALTTFGGGGFALAGAIGLFALGAAIKGGGMALSANSAGSGVSNTTTNARNTSPFQGALGFNGGTVKFEVEGTKLVGVLNNTNQSFGG